MHVVTKAIVLSKLRYKDHDLIVKCYTREFGTRSYLLKGILKSKRSQIKPAYFQTFSILQINADHNDRRSLQYVKDVKIDHALTSIHTNVIKSTIVLFLSEILTNILREEEPDLALYDFLEASITWFDMHDTYTNFHYLFLIELTKYLGFYPDMSNSDAPYFSLDQGKFQDVDSGVYCVSGKNLTLLKDVLGIKFDDTKKLKLQSHQKHDFMNMILLYFKLHLDGFKAPKSLAVLNQVFN